MLLESSFELIKERKAARTKEEKLAARREKAAKKKAKLQQFYQSSLYHSICNILGYDLKGKIRTLAYNSKWITIKNLSTLEPMDFDFDFSTYDIEAYLDDKGSPPFVNSPLV